MVALVRGRVIARTDDVLLLRTEQGDRQVHARGEVEPGDLVEVDADGHVRVARAYLRGDYPTPATEVARLARNGRMRALRRRADVLAAIRRFFGERGFVEVETPLLVAAPGLEVQLRAVPAGPGRWLITSPEYQMKRLLAAGMSRIFTLCKCFRGEEEGAQHSGEFTMLEWYRGWAGLDEIIADTEALVAEAVRAVRGEPVVVRGARRIDVSPPWPRITVAEAMQHYAGVEVRGDEDAEVLRARLVAAGIDPGTATAWDDLFYCGFVDRVEPAIAALDHPLLVVDWPVKLAALARRKPGNPSVVERFEAYVAGLELANAFGELTCPVEQRARFEDDLAERRERGLPTYPVDEKLIAALEEGLPPSAGIALGVDRLVMLALGAEHIRDVLAFTTDEL